MSNEWGPVSLKLMSEVSVRRANVLGVKKKKVVVELKAVKRCTKD